MANINQTNLAITHTHTILITILYDVIQTRTDRDLGWAARHAEQAEPAEQAEAINFSEIFSQLARCNDVCTVDVK